MANEDFIAVVDDDDALREMLCLMLQVLRLPVVGYPNAQAFLLDTNRRWCACLVLDLRMPGMSGIDLQRRLKAEGATIPIVFITAHGEIPQAVEAIREGAVDFLQKPIQGQELVDCVQRCVQNAPERRKQSHEKDVLLARIANLTPRERQVFDQIVAGRRSKHIADSLGVTLNTVEQYRSKVLQKMHASSTPDLLSKVASLVTSEGGTLPPSLG